MSKNEYDGEVAAGLSLSELLEESNQQAQHWFAKYQQLAAHRPSAGRDLELWKAGYHAALAASVEPEPRAIENAAIPEREDAIELLDEFFEEWSAAEREKS